MSLVVETGAGRSGAVSFVALLPLQAASLDPSAPSRRPGDPGRVRLLGGRHRRGGRRRGARGVRRSRRRSLRDAVAPGAPGSRHDVVASAEGRNTKPLPCTWAASRRGLLRSRPWGGRGPRAGPRGRIRRCRRRERRHPRRRAGPRGGREAHRDGGGHPPRPSGRNRRRSPRWSCGRGRDVVGRRQLPLQRLVEGTWVPRFSRERWSREVPRGWWRWETRWRTAAPALVEGPVALGGGARTARGRRSQRHRGPGARRPDRGLRGARGSRRPAWPWPALPT